MTVTRVTRALRRWWFLARMRHPWLRSRRARLTHRQIERRWAVARDYAEVNEVSLGHAIETLYGGEK